MASPTQWTWVWVNSGRWWWTGRPGVLQFMGLQRVRHNWATELNWTERTKSLPAMQETWVWSLGQEDPLEKEMATHSSILAWKTPWTEEPKGLQSIGLQRVRHNWAINTHRILNIKERTWSFFGRRSFFVPYLNGRAWRQHVSTFNIMILTCKITYCLVQISFNKPPT